MRAALLTLRFRGAGNGAVWAAIAGALATVTSLVAGCSLFLGSVGPASADLRIGARCPATTGLIVRSYLRPGDLPRLEARSRAVAAVASGRLQGARRPLTLEAQALPGPAAVRPLPEPATLAAKTGAARHLTMVQGGPRAGGALAPRSAAGRMGVRPGSSLRPAPAGGRSARTRGGSTAP